jgi:hypothetical protein
VKFRFLLASLTSPLLIGLILLSLISSTYSVPISNVVTGTSTVIAPTIEVVQGYDGNKLLPPAVGINVPYYPRINISLEAGRIYNVYLVLNFTSSQIAFQPDDVEAKICVPAGDSCVYQPFSEGAIVTSGNVLVIKHKLDVIGSGAVLFKKTYYLNITIVESAWMGKTFSYALGLAV